MLQENKKGEICGIITVRCLRHGTVRDRAAVGCRFVKIRGDKRDKGI